MKDKTLLIVGGTGFIGYNVAKRAVFNGFKKVYILSSKECPEHRRVIDAEYIIADITNFRQLKDKIAYKHINYVVNLSGYVNHSDFFEDGYSVIETHLLGLFNLLRCIEKKSIDGFVQIGSSDSYGNNLTTAQSESTREQSVSPYSFAKTAADHLIQMLYKQSDFPVVSMRLFLVYGPGQNEERFLPQIIKGCLNDETFKVSEGKQFRDFCYIDDVVKGILSGLFFKNSHGKVINLTFGFKVEIASLIEHIKKITGRGTPLYGEIPYRKGEPMILYANTALAKGFLCWNPKTPIVEGINKTIEYYKNIWEM